MQQKYKKKVKIVAFLLDLRCGKVYYITVAEMQRETLGGE